MGQSAAKRSLKKDEGSTTRIITSNIDLSIYIVYKLIMMEIPRVPDSSNHPFIDCIIKIWNKYTLENIPYNKIDIKFLKHPYSSKNVHCWCLEIDDEHISKHKPYIIQYKCQTCEKKVDVGITQFLRKIQKIDLTRCRYCVNECINKRKIHSELLLNNPCTRNWEKKEKSNNNITIIDKKKFSEQEFYNKLDTDEQQSYFSYHLTQEEFKRIQCHLYSLNHGRITFEELSSFEYFPIWKCSNQMNYTCVLYNPTKNIIEKPSQIQCKCENCDGLFYIKNLHRLKNKYKVFCSECSLCRNTFKKRHIFNINGDKVIVQSSIEIKFVNWCNENNILVKNGPKLKYEWNNSSHTYHVDFELPKIKWIIETKDNHCWHKDQLTNGRWELKEKCANEEVNKGIYKKFITIFPKKWMYWIKNILIQIRREDIV